MQIFSSTLRNLWTAWELPTLVLCSLLLQMALIPMGYYRKYTSNHWLRWLLWLAYLSADSAATISLGILSNYDDGSACDAESPDPRFVIRAFWAPFLLLHLGGPDTITAYSMQDNDLWLRHFLNLFVQAGLASYVFLRALKPTTLNFIAIPVFVSGIIKYGERTWVLRSASTEHLRDRLVPISIAGRSIFPVLKKPFSDDGVNKLHVAHGFFLRNKWIFADLVLNIQDLKETLCCFMEYDSISAFKVVEVELSFMHDFFYTKSSLIHSYWGALFRLTTLSSTVIAIATFCTTNTHRYPQTDVNLIFLLLFGALGLEIYSTVLLMRSDWCVIWLTKIDNFLARLTFKVVCGLGWSIKMTRWSNSVPQYNLITRCLQDIYGGGFFSFLRVSQITKVVDSQPISDELKDRIFKQLKEKVELENKKSPVMDSQLISNELKKRFFEPLKEKVELENEKSTVIDSQPMFDELKKQIFEQLKEVELENEKSTDLPDWIRKKRNLYKNLGWNMELDSDQSILLWHIATDLCYHSRHEKKVLDSCIEDTKSLSEFLAYLLVSRHSLFPNGMSQMRFNATVKDANKFLTKTSKYTDAEACKSILQDLDQIIKDLELATEPKDVKERGSSSVFHYGCWLARELQKLKENERWEIIGHMLVEMLADISCECRVYDHIEQLGHGGDLLTHVWLLLHHLGYSKQSYNVTTAEQTSEIDEFSKVVRGYNAIDSDQSRKDYLKNYLEGLK